MDSQNGLESSDPFQAWDWLLEATPLRVAMDGRQLALLKSLLARSMMNNSALSTSIAVTSAYTSCALTCPGKM